MLRYSKRKFGEILVAEGIVDKDAVEAALAEQERSQLPLGEILLAAGQITEVELARALGAQMGFPFIRIASYDIKNELHKDFSAEFLYRNRLLPLDRIGNSVIVAVAGVPPEEVQQFLATKFDADIYYYLCLISDVETSLRELLALSQDQVSEFSATGKSATAAKKKSGSIEATGAISGAGFAGTNWESIFDEAEKNLSSD